MTAKQFGTKFRNSLFIFICICGISILYSDPIYSENIIMDCTAPEVSISMTPSKCQWGKGVYGSTDQPGFDVWVKDSGWGIKTVVCSIADLETNYVETFELVAFGEVQAIQSWHGHSDINPSVFTGNQIQVTVIATDWGGNTCKKQSERIKIDAFKPQVKMHMDLSDACSGKYFNKEKVLTITVREKNFDASYVPVVQTGNRNGYVFGGWNVDKDIATGTITFKQDGKYSVTYECCDLAGNASGEVMMEEIIIDKTKPVLSVTYDDHQPQEGIYYNRQRTATVRITEHNFNLNQVMLQVFKDGEDISRQFDTWYSTGDIHRLHIDFKEDGVYKVALKYTDLAGNSAPAYKEEHFVIDMTPPEVIINNIKDDSANNDIVAPVIEIRDTNFSEENVQIQLQGVQKGEIDINNMFETRNLSQGINFVFDNFSDSMDDLYTLTVKVKDKAGNKTEKVINFSVNRDGSLYSVSSSTQQLLNAYYINKENDIIIEEENVDRIKSHWLTCSKDGDIVKLKPDIDYKVTYEEQKNGRKKYSYKVPASNFIEEGIYNIDLHTKDDAGNESSNKIKNVNIEFAMDKTAPSLIVTGIENGGRYDADVHEFAFCAKDNIKLSYVAYYLGDVLVKQYNEKEILEQDGIVRIKLESSHQVQKIKLTAYDKAGNKMESELYSVLVTPNDLVRVLKSLVLTDAGEVICLIAVIGIFSFTFIKIHNKMFGHKKSIKKL